MEIPPLPELGMERIRHIVSAPGYAITDHGRVFSCRMRVGVGCRGSVRGLASRWHEIRSHKTTKRGYRGVNLLLDDGRRRASKVHRLVLEAFVGPAPKGCVACHNNGDPTDNRVGNLRWDTVVNNHADKVRHGTQRMGEQVYAAKITTAIAREIKESIARGERNCDIAKRTGATTSIVEKIKAGTHWKHV